MITPEISFVIVNYNVKDFVVNCLMSIKKYANYPYEVILVDNNSKDNSVQEVKAKFPEVKVIENKFNAGFSGANNQGISIAQGKFIFLLNPDTELTENTLDQLMLLYKEKGDALYAPGLLNSDGSYQGSAWRFPTFVQVLVEALFISKLFKTSEYKISNTEAIKEVDSVSGAAMLFPAQVLKKIGEMDSSLFWMEDIDLCYRAKQLNYPVYYCTNSKVYHHSGKSASKNLNIAISNQLLSKLKFFKKHKLSLSFGLSVLFVFIHIVFRLILLSFLSVFKQKYFIKMKAYMFAFEKYFRYLFLNDLSVT